MQKKQLDHKYFMEKALEQAQGAYDAGEFPVGCVLVYEGDLVAVGSRRGTSDNFVRSGEMDHAEITALRNLELSSEKPDMADVIVYSTMEPCLMCYGAIVISGIRTIVYAYEDVMGGATKGDFKSFSPLYSDAGMIVIPGVLRQKSLDLFYDFFNKETNTYWKDSYLEKYTIEQKQDQATKTK